MPLEPTRTGLVARLGEYEPLRAFSQGGRYWDRVPQGLIREGGLAEFLPPVEAEEDERGKYGRFHRDRGRKELLSGSKPVGRRGIPAEQLQRLRQAIGEFKLKVNTQSAQPQNRELIDRFQLPDIAQDPELYRLAGPWWERRLQILWGCERTRDSSLPASAAVEKLRADKFYNLRRALTALLLLLFLLLPAWWLCANWSRLHSRPEQQAGQVEADRKARKAAQAAADAKRAQAVADQAKADALAAKKAADQAKAAPAPGARRNSSSSPTPGSSTPSAPAVSGQQPPGTVAATNASPPAAPGPKIACQIVLCDQGQPAPDGTMGVSLEVRTATTPARPVQVLAWHFENQTVTSQNRLQTRMKGGRHTVKAVILDTTGQRAEISAVVTVEPGKVITTPGKVSVKQR
jgi:hypothetical protein